MFRSKVLLGVVIAAVLVAALTITQMHRVYAQTGDCMSVDYTAIQQKLIDAQQALDGGNVVESLELQSDARQALRDVFNGCEIKPMLAGLGVDQSTIDAVSAMPFCQYRFEATVRSGADKGLNLTGTLALMQNSPKSAVGFVYSLDQTAAPVPVMADLGDQNAVTLHFSLPDEKTIVGNGYFTANIQSCFGGVEGVFTGPGSDDIGDWVGNGCILNPSSMNCTPSVGLNPSQLPILSPDPHPRPEQPNQPEHTPPICVPMRDAACVAACNGNATCAFACPSAGSTCG